MLKHVQLSATHCKSTASKNIVKTALSCTELQPRGACGPGQHGWGTESAFFRSELRVFSTVSVYFASSSVRVIPFPCISFEICSFPFILFRFPPVPSIAFNFLPFHSIPFHFNCISFHFLLISFDPIRFPPCPSIVAFTSFLFHSISIRSVAFALIRLLHFP